MNASPGQQVRRGTPKVIAWFVLIGFAAWELSPFNGGVAAGFFFVAAYFAYLLKPRRRTVLWVVSLYVASWTDILGVATLHDLTIKTHASARCFDGSYSYSTNRQGTCSWHQGVRAWNPEIPRWWKSL